MARGFSFILLVALIAAFGLFAIEYLKPPTSSKLLSDDFSDSTFTLTDGQTSPNGLWYAYSDGNGEIKVVSDYNSTRHNSYNVLSEWPKASMLSNETHSALTLSVSSFRDFHLSIDVQTNSQIRKNSPPNPWEVAWIIWHWKDNTHFNYFLVKTNGAETGKYDGGSNPADQKILKMVSYPMAQIGKWMHWDITIHGKHIIAEVNSDKVFDFADQSSFTDGKIGLYCEDSVVSFSNVNVDVLPANLP